MTWRLMERKKFPWKRVSSIISEPSKGHMDTEQISALCGQSQQQWPDWEPGDQIVGQWIRVLKKPQAGLHRGCQSGWKCPGPWQGLCLGWIVVIVPFLLQRVSTMSIVCSVTLFWTIAPLLESSEEVWMDSVHLGWRDRILLLECCHLMIFALDSKL